MSHEIERLLVQLLGLWGVTFGFSVLLYGLGVKRAPAAVAVAPFRFALWILRGFAQVFTEVVEAVLREVLRIFGAVFATVGRAAWDTFRMIFGIVWERISAGAAAAHQYYYGRYPRATAGVYTAAAFAAGISAYLYFW